MKLNRILSETQVWLAILISFVAITLNTQAAAQTEKVIYNFQSGLDGASPSANLIADRSGNLYGTTPSGGADGYGTVFELTPPSTRGGSWTEKVLHAFQGADGALPFSPLVFDQAGNLYGATQTGGNQPPCFLCGAGTIFKLTPPTTPGGGWTESVLHSFAFSDGASPDSGLTFDDEGNLYGTTDGGGPGLYGTVFELSPPDDNSSGPWREKVLYGFLGGNDGAFPIAGVVLGRAGSLYGTASLGGVYGAGVVFELVRPGSAGGSWTENVLYSFTDGDDGAEPFGGVIRGPNGALFGTAGAGGNQQNCYGGCGSVYELAPPKTEGGTWTETTLYDFIGGADGGQPSSNLVIDAAGRLYGTASIGGVANAPCSPYCGTVFELSSPRPGAWTETTLHRFRGGNDGDYPYAGLLLGDGGVLYGVAEVDGSAGFGDVFEITPR